MATSLWFKASDQATTRETTKLHLASSEGTKPELITKSNRGRKLKKAPQQKKQPQRGLGVAQLERLRLQEPLNKMTDIPQLQPLNHSDQFQLQALPVSEPLGGVPVQYGALNFNGAPVLINSSGGAFFGVNRAGLAIQSSGNRTGFGCDVDVGGLAMNQVMVDPSFYGIGVSDHQRLFHVNNIGAGYETSKELSSIPNTIPSLFSGRCDTCCKRKPLDGGNIDAGLNFQGFNRKKILNVGGETNVIGLGSITAAKTFSNISHNNVDEEVEVVAVHRKGNTGHGGGGGNLVMEYEFFPSAYKNDRGTYPEDMEILLCPSEASVNYSVAGYEAAAASTTTYGSDNTNFVDLSLKLSY